MTTHQDLTDELAGPFCTCGDYSCPANGNSNAHCVNRDDDYYEFPAEQLAHEGEDKPMTATGKDGQAVAMLIVGIATRQVESYDHAINSHAIAAATYLAPADGAASLDAARITTAREHLDALADLIAVRDVQQHLIDKYRTHI